MSSADDWSGERVTRWLRQAAALDREFAAVSRALFAAAAIAPGEHVLDVGCGSGPTTRTAAAASGTGGRVVGVDLSGKMLAAAAAEPVAPGSAELDWVETDVVGWRPEPASVDVVISRFGVMFFADPRAALTALARATRPGGRLAVAVWGRRDESPLFEVPYQAALAVCEERRQPVTPMPVDRGPFSWHDAGEVERLLESAGWTGVGMAAHRLGLPFAGGADPEAAAQAALDFGATRALAAEVDDATRAEIRAGIARAFAEHVDPEGHVVLDGAVRIVTARRSAQRI